MDELTVLAECIVKVEEIKEELDHDIENATIEEDLGATFENEEYDILKNVIVKKEPCELELTANGQQYSEEEELKPSIAVFLQPKEEAESGKYEDEQRKDPLPLGDDPEMQMDGSSSVSEDVPAAHVVESLPSTSTAIHEVPFNESSLSEKELTNLKTPTTQRPRPTRKRTLQRERVGVQPQHARNTFKDIQLRQIRAMEMFAEAAVMQAQAALEESDNTRRLNETLEKLVTFISRRK